MHKHHIVRRSITPTLVSLFNIQLIAFQYRIYICVYIKAKCDKGGYSVSYDIASGKRKISFAGDLTPDCEYYAFAFGLTEDCEVTTDITTTYFKTTSFEEAAAGIDNGDRNLVDLGRAKYRNYEDYYNVGAANWLMPLITDDYAGSLNIELQTDLSATETPLGEYPFSTSLEAGTAVIGELKKITYGDSSIYISTGSYWQLYNLSTSHVEELAYLKSGVVTIGKNGNDYTIDLNALDGHGNTITMSYTGPLEQE